MGSARRFAAAAIAASLVLHIVLVWVVLRQGVAAPPVPRVISVVLVKLPPPPPPPKPVPPPPKPVPPPPKPVPPPKPLPPPKPIPLPKPVPVHARSRPSLARPKTLAQPPSALHFGPAGPQADLGLNLGANSANTGNGTAAIGAFEDAVKQRIEAAKTYPPALPYLWNECVVSYRVTVDPRGQLLDYKLYGCGNPFLDSATRAAILSASPFAVPPNFGGSQYTVYGSLVYKHRSDTP